MAKKRNSPPKPVSNKTLDSVAKPNTIKSNSTNAIALPEWLTQSSWHVWGLGLLAVLLYANTIGHGYTLDDAIVIYDNMFTTQGLKGIGGLLSYDTFYGFFKESGKAALVAGGRYRPFTPIMFAVEWQFFGKNTLVNHLINVVTYALCCVLIYKVLRRMLLVRWAEAATPIALLAAFLFTVHPLHTEVVANIKGRDEIMTLLLSFAALACTWRAWMDEAGRKWDVLAAVAFLFALLSKENAIAFVALAPLTLRVFGNRSWETVFQSAIPYAAGAAVFLAMRANAIGWQFGGKQMELMNNPFLKLEGGQWVSFTAAERLGTIMLTLGKYILLFLFPHPLSHDYYPRQIDITSLGNPGALLSLLLYGFLIWLSFRVFKGHSLIAYGVAFYLATLFVVSNIIFPIGTNMGERFVFMPSLGLCLVVAMLAFTGWKEQVFKLNMPVLGAIALVGVLFSAKTVMRNTVWSDDLTLFSTDVFTSPKSAKLQNACAGSKFNAALKVTDKEKRGQLLDEALAHATAAIQIHPTYRNAYTIKGHVLLTQSKLDSAILTYEYAQKLDANFMESKMGLASAYRERGKFAGEKQGDLNGALSFLQKAIALNPKDAEANRLMGVAYGIGGNTPLAVEYFGKAVALDPENPSILYDCGSAYKQAGKIEEGNALQAKALQLKPTLLQDRAAGK